MPPRAIAYVDDRGQSHIITPRGWIVAGGFSETMPVTMHLRGDGRLTPDESHYVAEYSRRPYLAGRINAACRGVGLLDERRYSTLAAAKRCADRHTDI